MIRPANPNDITAILAVAVEAKLFSAEETTPLKNILEGYFQAGANQEHVWMIDEQERETLGVAYYAAAQMSDRTWYIKMIAVSPDHQGRGRGAAMMRHIESELSARGKRVLLVETSSLPLYDRTRTFYLNCGYDEEARIRDYYADGEDMIVFRKSIAAR
jgi:ribosomal protein S18 acetylase RimI-like enzyme